MQLTFWFDCGGRTGRQMGSVFDALWVEYSWPNCLQFDIGWSKNRWKPTVRRSIQWLKTKKMGFFHFFWFLLRLSRFFLRLKYVLDRPKSYTIWFVLERQIKWHLTHVGPTTRAGDTRNLRKSRFFDNDWTDRFAWKHWMYQSIDLDAPNRMALFLQSPDKK